MPFSATAQGRLWYADRRQEGVVPRLLLHGAGGSHLVFPAVLRRAGSLAPDLPGHGKSPGPGRDTVEAYAAAVLALLDALAVPAVDVIGHSLGGAVALALALAQPPRVRRLILLASSAHFNVHPAILDGLSTAAPAALALINRWQWAATAPDDLKQAGLRQLLAADVAVTRGDFVACQRCDLRPRLGEITQPALIIGGSADRMTPPDWQQALAAGLPAATLHFIDGAGHMLLLEQPQPVADSIAQWSAGL
ncbi:MAG: alpha/beta fold hydrolase [Anaerolineae bacterium]|nr:alpha/beta fold hydrolase [Anaerolineae bacterium]